MENKPCKYDNLLKLFREEAHTIKTEEELNKYVEDGKLIEVSSDGVLLESKNNEENLLDELYGNTKEVLPNGLVVYHIRHVDYF